MASTRRAAVSSGPLIPIVAGIAVLYFARDIFIPLALALTVSFLLTPLVNAAEKLRVGRITAVLTVLLLTTAALGGLGWIVGDQLLQVASELPQYRDNIHEKIAAFHAPSTGMLGKLSTTVKELGSELSGPTAPPPSLRQPGRVKSTTPTPVQIVDPPENDLQYLRDLLMPVAKPLGQFGVVLVFTLFILLKREDLRNRLLRLAGLGQLNVVTQALDDGARRISKYLTMQLLVNIGYGVLFGLGLFLIGVPNAFLWGTLAAVLRIVPYVGTLVAAALPLGLALAVFNTWTAPIFVVVLYAVLEGITGNVLEPWLYGAHTGVSSLALLVTTVFWTVLWGWTGLVLSTPLTVCVIVLGRYVPQLSFLYVLLGDEAPLTPDVQFYQRLLALDLNEARSVAETFLKDHTLLELYDGVLIPGLVLAEQDRHKGALDEAREQFLFLSAGELMAELAGAGLPPAEAPPDRALRVFCVPASDRADELAAAMLAQTLEQRGFLAMAFPHDTPWEESLHALSPGDADIVCISSVPPFAFTNARTAILKIRRVTPRTRILVGMWGSTVDPGKVKERFGNVTPHEVVATLATALVWIEGVPKEGDEGKVVGLPRLELETSTVSR